MEDNTDADYTHSIRVFKILKQKKCRRISWSVCSKRYITVTWCIWELLEYVPWNIWTRHCTFPCRTRISVDVKYLEKLHGFHNCLPFLPKIMENEMLKKLVVNLHDKKESVIHVRNLKQTLNYGLVLKKFIEFSH